MQTFISSLGKHDWWEPGLWRVWMERNTVDDESHASVKHVWLLLVD